MTYTVFTWNKYTGTGRWKTFKEKPRARAHLWNCPHPGQAIFTSNRQIRGRIRNADPLADKWLIRLILMYLKELEAAKQNLKQKTRLISAPGKP